MLSNGRCLIQQNDARAVSFASASVLSKYHLRLPVKPSHSVMALSGRGAVLSSAGAPSTWALREPRCRETSSWHLILHGAQRRSDRRPPDTPGSSSAVTDAPGPCRKARVPVDTGRLTGRRPRRLYLPKVVRPAEQTGLRVTATTSVRPSRVCVGGQHQDLEFAGVEHDGASLHAHHLVPVPRLILGARACAGSDEACLRSPTPGSAAAVAGRGGVERALIARSPSPPDPPTRRRSTRCAASTRCPVSINDRVIAMPAITGTRTRRRARALGRGKAFVLGCARLSSSGRAGRAKPALGRQLRVLEDPLDPHPREIDAPVIGPQGHREEWAGSPESTDFCQTRSPFPRDDHAHARSRHSGFSATARHGPVPACKDDDRRTEVEARTA